MTDRPIRIQLRRTKGWRMPENTVKVDRRTIWGNPWGVGAGRGYSIPMSVHPWWLGIECHVEASPITAEIAVKTFRAMLAGDGIDANLLPVELTITGQRDVQVDLETRRKLLMSRLHSLRGKNLACWCALDACCHADVLLDLANGRADT